MTLLRVERLRVAFRAEGRLSVPVRDVSFDIPENGRVALVGESGCGKSLTALALGGLVDRAEISGTITGRSRIAYVFQNPMQSLNPVMRVGAQVAEGLKSNAQDSGLKVEGLLKSVGLPEGTARKFPCEMSGGQQQRVMIAMALAQEPDLLIADEPTTALDVTTQRDVLDLIARIADERRMAVLLITHNLGLVSRYSKFVNVMYAGEIVERGEVQDVLRAPRHPYTQGLIAAVPRLDAPKDAPLADIPGTVPPPTDWPTGCAFHPRCPKARPECATPAYVPCGARTEEGNDSRRVMLTVATATMNAVSKGRMAALERCVRSVAAVGVPHEHLIFDGGSVDGSVERLRELERQLPSLKVVSAADRGLYDALNSALAVAKGDWFLVLGDDDLICDPRVLDAELAALDGSDAEVAVTGVKWGNEPVRTARPHMILSGMSCPHAGVLCRTPVMRDCGGFDVRYRISGDYDLTLRLLLGNARVRKFSSPYAFFNDSGGLSTTQLDLADDEDVLVKMRNLKIAPRHRTFIRRYRCLPCGTSLRLLFHQSAVIRRAAIWQLKKRFAITLRLVR